MKAVEHQCINNLHKVLSPLCQVAVLGAGISGLAVLEFLSESRTDTNFFICDDGVSEQIYKKLEDVHLSRKLFVGGLNDNAKRLCNVDVLVLSPGIPRSLAVLQKAFRNGVQIVNELEIAAAFLPECTFVGVTGSNGKSSVVSLLYEMAKFDAVARGLDEHTVFLGGNFGTTLISKCLKAEVKPEIAILELSSYQLETIQYLPLKAAAITNLAPDHLDRYQSVADYYLSKFQITKLVEKGKYTFLNQVDRNSLHIYKKYLSQVEHDFEVRYFNTMGILDTFKIDHQKFPGEHHLQNVACAIGLAEALEFSSISIQEALDCFEALAHRQQLVTEFAGHRYWDDSKATNIASAMASIRSMSDGAHVILGGVGKGDSYTELRLLCEVNQHKIYAIGQEMPVLKKAFEGFQEFYLAETIAVALQMIFKNISAKEEVLLAPACASFDQFRNYKERGLYFQKLVLSQKKLEIEEKHSKREED